MEVVIRAAHKFITGKNMVAINLKPILVQKKE